MWPEWHELGEGSGTKAGASWGGLAAPGQEGFYSQYNRGPGAEKPTLLLEIRRTKGKRQLKAFAGPGMHPTALGICKALPGLQDLPALPSVSWQYG